MRKDVLIKQTYLDEGELLENYLGKTKVMTFYFITESGNCLPSIFLFISVEVEGVWWGGGLKIL